MQRRIDLRRAGDRGSLDIALDGRPAKRQRMLFFERRGTGEDDYRGFCVTERASVTSVSRNEKADNRLIISFLLGAENETRTRDPNAFE